MEHDSHQAKKRILLHDIDHALASRLGLSATAKNEPYASVDPLIEYLSRSSSSLILCLLSSPKRRNSPPAGPDQTFHTNRLDCVGSKFQEPGKTIYSDMSPTPECLQQAFGISLGNNDILSLKYGSVKTVIQHLAARYGQVAHMSILDVSYRFFLNKARTGAVVYKLQTGVAVVCGDPLCEWTEIASVMNEFANFRHRNHLDIAFMGASDAFAKGYAQCKGWTMIEFGTQRALNPQTNTVLLGQAGKRIASQSRQLLNAQKGGIVLGVYTPAVHGTDLQLQASLVAIYEAWRAERNASAGLQAFITVYDLFALPELMTFIYAQSSGGLITGFAAIRQLGDGGYHLDPCIVAPGSPNGMTDLLVVAAMTLLRRAGVSSLGHGIEPSQSLSMENIVGIPGPVAKMARKLYDQTIPHLPIHGKKAYHDKFRPDSSKTSALYLIFPSSVFGLRYLLAMIHLANIGLRKLLLADFKARVSTGKSKSVVGHT